MTRVALTIRQAMIEAARRARSAPTASERYRWEAAWWRLHARESCTPGECLGYARALMARARQEAQA